MHPDEPPTDPPADEPHAGADESKEARRSPSSVETDPDLPDGVVRQGTRERGLPPGSSTLGDEEEIPGNVRHGAPFEDAPGEGRLSPGGDNPPPPD